MNVQREAGSDGRIVRRYEYDDSSVLVADVGASTDEVDVDVVGTTAIVVIDTDDGVAETEFELPGTDVDVAVLNGVLTITVEK